MCQRRPGFYPLLLWTSYINSLRLRFLICKMDGITVPQKCVLRIKEKVPGRPSDVLQLSHTGASSTPSSPGPLPVVPWHQPHSGNRAIGTALGGLKSVTWLRSVLLFDWGQRPPLCLEGVTQSDLTLWWSLLEKWVSGVSRPEQSTQSTQTCCVNTWRERGRDGKRPNPGFSPPLCGVASVDRLKPMSRDIPEMLVPGASLTPLWGQSKDGEEGALNNQGR